MKDIVVAILRAALDQAQAQGKLKSVPVSIGVEAPRDPAHGDIASNVALTMARAEGQPPRAIAEIILEHIELGRQVLEAKVAGPGFINFKMASGYWQAEIRRAVREGDRFWRPQIGADKKVQVEFLSANPTGPLTVGHGRNAVLGDTIARLYAATGHRVTREYYFNDGGRQMKLLGESVQARYLEQLGRTVEFPEDGYHGEYIREIAAGLHRAHGPALADQIDIAPFRAAAVEAIFADIKRTCERLSVRFDVYANELDLIRGGAVEAALAGLRERGLIAEYDGAVWLRAEPLKLPKDAVLVRSTGEPTYRTPDIAYHVEKLRRGFDQIIDVFGADHIAEHEEVIAAVRALGYDTTPIRAIIYQFVTLTRGGEKIKMSTRKATYVTLDELIDEVGADVVRFFFMFRKSDSHLDFDLDLAKRQAPENPVFYVQYAHARLCSVFREAEKAGYESTAAGRRSQGRYPQSNPSDLLGFTSDTDVSPHSDSFITAANLEPDLALLSEEEFALAKRAVGMPAIVAAATLELEPHRIPFYLLETAAEFHRYYNKPSNRIIGPDRALSMARLYLCGLLRDELRNGLELIGVSAPERM